MEGGEGSEPSRSRGRGRGKSRGGLGKYLRARGRGRGGGRPAEFGKRLVLESEEVIELDPDSEEAAQEREFQQKFSRRQLDSNADRYAEPEPVLNSDGKRLLQNPFPSTDAKFKFSIGEEEIEPEVDLSSFLERQRLSGASPSLGLPPAAPTYAEDEVDHSLAHISSRPQATQSKKGRIQTVQWDAELEEMTREKAATEATWGTQVHLPPINS